MRLVDIQREYCRKAFICCAFDYKQHKSNPRVYIERILNRLTHLLVDTQICSDIMITFDESIWACEPINTMEYRGNQLEVLFDGTVAETNYQNVIKFSYKMHSHVYDTRSIVIDLRQNYDELINTEFYVD